MASADPILIDSLRGGLNNTDPAIELPDDQVVLCENMDLDRSTLGGRRLGHVAVTVSVLAGTVVFLHRHIPSNDPTAAELWGVSVDAGAAIFGYKDTSWHDETPGASDTLDVAAGQYHIKGAGHRGKLFLAYPSSVDRLHVWDGTSVRRTGLAEPAAPTVANTGSGAYEATTRYYRVRYVTLSGSTVLRRSEPSDAQIFTPSGTGTAARVTKPAAISEGETHWELEASIDNVDFYRIARTVVGTTTYDDSAAPITYATTGTLSEDIGDYTLQYSPKHLIVDEDRLLIGGSWEQPALSSRVSWSPVGGAFGVGNDERLAEDTDPFLDCDAQEGGELTDMGGPIQGYTYGFKRSAIYRLVRTQNRVQSYIAIRLTDTMGALPRSVVMGRDERGAPALYVLDPATGPYRIGRNGIENCGNDILGTWNTVNAGAALVTHGVYVPALEQVWWYLATGGSSVPNLKIKLHTRRTVPGGPDGVTKGWSIDTGDYMSAFASCLFADNIEANTARSLSLKPFIGRASSPIVAMADSGTSDNGDGFRARLRTRPIVLGKFFRKFGVRVGSLVAAVSSGATISITLLRDFATTVVAGWGVTKTVSLTATAEETAAGAATVIRPVDDLKLSELYAVQIELGDSAASTVDWALDAVVLGPRSEGTL